MGFVACQKHKWGFKQTYFMSFKCVHVLLHEIQTRSENIVSIDSRRGCCWWLCVSKPLNDLLTSNRETFLKSSLKHIFSIPAPFYFHYSKINTFSNSSETSVQLSGVLEGQVQVSCVSAWSLAPILARLGCRTLWIRVEIQSGFPLRLSSLIPSQKNMYWLSIALLRPLSGGSSSQSESRLGTRGGKGLGWRSRFLRPTDSLRCKGTGRSGSDGGV